MTPQFASMYFRYVFLIYWNIYNETLVYQMFHSALFWEQRDSAQASLCPRLNRVLLYSLKTGHILHSFLMVNLFFKCFGYSFGSFWKVVLAKLVNFVLLVSQKSALSLPFKTSPVKSLEPVGFFCCCFFFYFFWQGRTARCSVWDFN